MEPLPTPRVGTQEPTPQAAQLAAAGASVLAGPLHGGVHHATVVAPREGGTPLPEADLATVFVVDTTSFANMRRAIDAIELN